MIEAAPLSDNLSVIHNVIDYTATSPIARWIPNGIVPDRIKANPGDQLSFEYNGPDTVIEVVVMVGPLVPDCSSPSPFDAPSPVHIKPYQTLRIKADAKGVWGFSIAFRTQSETTGASAFYFVPDPELAVGSIGAQ